MYQMQMPLKKTPAITGWGPDAAENRINTPAFTVHACSGEYDPIVSRSFICAGWLVVCFGGGTGCFWCLS